MKTSIQQINELVRKRRMIVATITLLSCMVLPALPQDTDAAAHPEGKLLWKFEVRGSRAYLAAANGVIYAASPTGCSDFVPCGPPARLFAFDARTGKQKWMIENIADASAPVISDGLVYQAGGSLYAVNAQTGRVEWEFKPTAGGGVGHSPVIADGVIFFWETGVHTNGILWRYPSRS